MVVEVKNSVPVDFMMSNPSILPLSIDANWHCLSLECHGNDDRMHISKYSHFTSTLPLKTIETIPKLLQ